MTAGHFVLPKSYSDSSNESRTTDDSDDESDESDEWDDYDESDEESFEFVPSSINASFENEEEGGGGGGEGGGGGRGGRGGIHQLLEIEKSIKNQRTQEYPKLGMLSYASDTLGDGQNLDWALIALSEEYMFYPPNLYKNKDLVGTGDGTFFPPGDFVVLLSARGPLRGYMSSSFSYIMQPPGKVLIRTHLLTFDLPECDGPLKYGDSGAWVVNPGNYNVYGHLVASDAFGRGYVVPITDSFDNIKNQLYARSVSLRTVRDESSNHPNRDSAYSSMDPSPETHHRGFS